jgi:gamma-glutamyltranspeptidase/glutathione hydrolase
MASPSAVVRAAAGQAARPTSGESALGVPSATGLVVSTSSHASDVGASILQQGGNAVDAAVATGLALAVTHPAAGNIGGGGFMLIRLPSGEVTSIDYREKAPLKSTLRMYLNAAGNIDRSLTAAGYLAPGVPGTVRGLALAHQKLGRLPWKAVVLPAVRLAEDGFIMPEVLARSLNAQLAGRMGKFPSSVEAYGKPGGGKWAAGDRLVLKDLGRSLRAIAENGPDAFYTGWIADAIERDMKANGGIMTKEDLAAYQPAVRTPVRGQFRDFEIVSMPPPSSGGVAMIEMLNILERYDLKKQGAFAPATLHLKIEAMRRAFLDRARFLGDPDFGPIPVARLISKEHAQTLAAGIAPGKATRSAELGRDLLVPSAESNETTHFSVLDRDGMAVANTYTLEGSYGSFAVVRGAGFLLNNEMGDFNKQPGVTNDQGDIGTKANQIAPGKRMLSSMTPTIVSRNGRLVLVTGSPGGRTIINTVFGIVLGVTEFGLTGREAVDAPRMHHQWMPDSVSFEQDAIPPEVAGRLREMGHVVKVQGRQGDAHSIWIDPKSGIAYGVNDRRSADSKASK